MENQHRKIKGYRELTQQEIDLMNRIKEMGIDLDILLSDLRANASMDVEVNPGLEAAEPHRWIQIGKTHLQQGLMALTRAVAKPEFF